MLRRNSAEAPAEVPEGRPDHSVSTTGRAGTIEQTESLCVLTDQHLHVSSRTRSTALSPNEMAGTNAPAIEPAVH